MENVSSNVCYLKREQIASFLGVSQEKADLYLFYAKDVETKKNGTKYFNIDELKDIQKSQEQKELAKENKRKADTNQTCAKNAQVGKVNTEEEEYLTIEQVAKKLGIERNTAIEKLSKVGVKAIKSKTLKNKNGVALNVYSNKEITEVSEQQQQATLAKIDNKAEKILDKEGAIVVANSFKKVLEEADPFEVLKMTTALNQLSMEKMFDLLNTKDRTISILDEKVSSLEVEVGKSKEYYSIKKVAIINSKKEKDYKWSLLKKESVVLGKEIKTERDNNYGNVNSYHIDVWKKVYPTENYS